jgi:hypothetical protein
MICFTIGSMTVEHLVKHEVTTNRHKIIPLGRNFRLGHKTLYVVSKQLNFNNGYNRRSILYVILYVT